MTEHIADWIVRAPASGIPSGDAVLRAVLGRSGRGFAATATPVRPVVNELSKDEPHE